MIPSAFGVTQSAGGVEGYSMGHWWGDSTLRFVAISGSHGMGETWFLKGKVRYACLKKGEGISDGQVISQSFTVKCT